MAGKRPDASTWALAPFGLISEEGLAALPASNFQHVDTPLFKALVPTIANDEFEDMLLEGEHQRQDFKFRITDSKKIARSLVAFANSEGGRLLVGVKDSGRIAGVRSDEEFYMVEAASQMYTEPEVPIEPRLWEVDGKRVLEVIVRRSSNRPHKAKGDDGKWMTYIRKGDQNLLANRVLIKVWQHKGSTKGLKIQYTEVEESLLNYLRENESITISKFRRMADISLRKAEEVLVRLVCWDILKMEISTQGAIYKLVPRTRD